MKHTIKISQQVIEAIIDHAKREIPSEACGYLAAHNGTITKHYELTNLDRANDHFSMDPGEQFAAIKDMRSRNLKLAAVYHSHPETPARPSREDIKLAFDPLISYVIVSLSQPNVIVQSFKISQGNVTREEIEPVKPTVDTRTQGSLENQSPPMEDNVKKNIEIAAVKNCRGVGCPMNLVYTKVELAKLNSGQILEIILDDGAPVHNVPASAQKEGHAILEQSQLADGTWSVLIEKA